MCALWNISALFRHTWTRNFLQHPSFLRLDLAWPGEIDFGDICSARCVCLPQNSINLQRAYAYPRRNGQAELTWMADYIPRKFIRTKVSPLSL